MLAFCTVKGCIRITGNKYGGTTGVLIPHVQNKHHELRQKLTAAQDGGRVQAAKSGNRINIFMMSAPGFCKCTLRWVVMTNTPLSTMDCPWFKKMILTANLRLDMIGMKMGVQPICFFMSFITLMH